MRAHRCLRSEIDQVSRQSWVVSSQGFALVFAPYTGIGRPSLTDVSVAASVTAPAPLFPAGQHEEPVTGPTG